MNHSSEKIQCKTGLRPIREGIRELVDHWTKYTEKHGDYLE
jgi:hypothetical protein